MNDNELEDKTRHRTFIFFMGLLVVLPIVGGITVGLPAILLAFGQGPLLADIVKIVLGFIGGTGAGALIGTLRR